MSSPSHPSTPQLQTIRVWDLPVRLSHWALACCVFANLLITEEGSDVHEYVGYAAVAIVMFRLVWGFVGNRHARFADFWPTPSRLIAHGRALLGGHQEQHPGHNPFGALMMLALWAVILGLGVSGYLMGTDRFWGDERVENIHYLLANSLYPLIGLHVLSALLMSVVTRVNLVRAMITGNKTMPVSTDRSGQ